MCLKFVLVANQTTHSMWFNWRQPYQKLPCELLGTNKPLFLGGKTSWLKKDDLRHITCFNEPQPYRTKASRWWVGSLREWMQIRTKANSKSLFSGGDLHRQTLYLKWLIIPIIYIFYRSLFGYFAQEARLWLIQSLHMHQSPLSWYQS